MPDLAATVCNPLLRTPLSLIVDDSCPVVNLTYFWIRQRHAWLRKHRPGVEPGRGDGDPARMQRVAETIPAAFARKWAEWCGEQGIRGKFSFVPFPAGVGRVDHAFDGYPASELRDWLDVARNVLAPNFDLTPEMLTHSLVVDLATWELTEDWEQFEWADPPVEPLADYIAAAMELLANVGITALGVTSPGGFGNRNELAYARATLEAAQRVNGVARLFYFLRITTDELPSVPVRFAQQDEGVAIASIVGCTGDWFGGWTGYDAGDADRYITEDLDGGRLPEVLREELPCVLLGHWPGFYFNGDEVGLTILKEVKRRLDAYDPDGSRTIWMTNSEIGHYWMARELATIEARGDAVAVQTRFPTRNFTLRLEGCRAGRVQVDGVDLREAASRHFFRSGMFLVEGGATVVAFDLAEGETRVVVDGED